MDQAVKNTWTAALRSGEYQQGGGSLRRHDDDGDKYCCLGVLCDLAVKANIIPEPVLKGRLLDSYIYGTAGDTDHWFLPEAVQNWAGLEDADPDVDDGASTLSKYNDSGKSFSEIADVIEREL